MNFVTMHRFIRNPLLLLFGCLILCNCSKSTPNTAFSEEFGFPPPASINNIKVADVEIGDTSLRWMAFSCDESTLSRILALGFKKMDYNEKPTSNVFLTVQDTQQRNVNAPTWWKTPVLNKGLRMYRWEPDAKSRTRGYIYIWMEESTHTLYFEARRWT